MNNQDDKFNPPPFVPNTMFTSARIPSHRTPPKEVSKIELRDRLILIRERLPLYISYVFNFLTGPPTEHTAAATEVSTPSETTGTTTSAPATVHETSTENGYRVPPTTASSSEADIATEAANAEDATPLFSKVVPQTAVKENAAGEPVPPVQQKLEKFIMDKIKDCEGGKCNENTVENKPPILDLGDDAEDEEVPEVDTKEVETGIQRKPEAEKEEKKGEQEKEEWFSIVKNCLERRNE